MPEKCLSLVQIETFDRGSGGDPSRHCCPLCGIGKSVCTTHRCLVVFHDTGRYFCHRCQAQGKLDGSQWREPSPEEIRAREAAIERKRRMAVREALDASVSINGTPGMEYLRWRGLPVAVIEAQGGSALRFCPDFYGRPAVLFPITACGQVVAIQGRYIDGGELRMRSVGSVRAGVYAAPGAYRGGNIAITEAPIDALSLCAMGYHAVAAMGTRFPESILPFVIDHKISVQIATDNDQAGEEAAVKWGKMFDALLVEHSRLRPQCKDWNEQRTSGSKRTKRTYPAGRGIAPDPAGHYLHA